MKIQVNSGRTINVDASLTRFVESEVIRVLGRFESQLTRVEVHLSDIDNLKTGQADKRCLIEVRPRGDRPRSASAKAVKMASAIGGALGKMKRSLISFFGRTGRSATVAPAPHKETRKRVAGKSATAATKKKPPVQKAASRKTAKLDSRGPKKKTIYRARRKSWPAR